MASEEARLAESTQAFRRAAAPPRRPWFLIAASLLLVVLSVVLWGKWRESRERAEHLQAELKDVYAEAETLRTQSARATQRITQLERDLKALSAMDARIKKSVTTPGSPRAAPRAQ